MKLFSISKCIIVFSILFSNSANAQLGDLLKKLGDGILKPPSSNEISPQKNESKESASDEIKKPSPAENNWTICKPEKFNITKYNLSHGTQFQIDKFESNASFHFLKFPNNPYIFFLLFSDSELVHSGQTKFLKSDTSDNSEKFDLYSSESGRAAMAIFEDVKKVRLILQSYDFGGTRRLRSTSAVMDFNCELTTNK